MTFVFVKFISRPPLFLAAFSLSTCCCFGGTSQSRLRRRRILNAWSFLVYVYTYFVPVKVPEDFREELRRCRISLFICTWINPPFLLLLNSSLWSFSFSFRVDNYTVKGLKILRQLANFSAAFCDFRLLQFHLHFSFDVLASWLDLTSRTFATRSSISRSFSLCPWL